MAEGDSQKVDHNEKMEKDEMLEVLTSTGKIKSTLAGSLYDQGLDDPKILLDADKAALTEYKGVGPKTAEALLEIAELKRKELEDAAVVPDIREVLEGVPRITRPVIENLIEAGYVDLSHFQCVTNEDLREIKGVGPKLSISIIETVNEAIERYGAEPVIEDATAESPAEDEVEEEEAEEAPQKGIIDKIIDGIKSIFGGGKKKEEKAPEEEKTEEPKEGAEEEEAPAEEPDEEEKNEEPSEDEKIDEPQEDEEKESEVPVEEPPQEEDKEEDVPEEEPAQEDDKESEVPEEDQSEEEEEAKGPEEGTKEEEETPDQPKPSILDKIMGFFKGSKKEEEPPEGQAAKEEEEDEKEPSDDEPQEPEKEEGVEEQDPAPDEEKEVQEVIEAGPTITEIEDVPGIGEKVSLKLKEAGYMNVQELKEAVPEDLLMIEGIGEKTAEKICRSVKEV